MRKSCRRRLASGRKLIQVLVGCGFIWLGHACGAGQPVAPRPAPIPRFHLGCGLWWRYWRIEEAIGEMGGAIYDQSWDVYGSPHGYCGCGSPMGDFPRTERQLRQYSVIVLAGCRLFGIPAITQKRVLAWVKSGGGLLILGGYQPFSQSGWRNSPLAEALPVTVLDKPNFHHFVPSVKMVPGAMGKGLFSDLSWKAAPRVFFIHLDVTPKKDAAVLLRAGDQPMLMSRGYGRGRVMLFNGTVCGDPKKKERPFWQWKDWSRLLGTCLKKLSRSPVSSRPLAEGQSNPDREKALQQLRELAQPDLDEIIDEDDLLDDEDTAPAPKKVPATFARIRKLAEHCDSPAFALEVVRSLTESLAVCPVGKMNAFFMRLRPFLKGNAFTEYGKRLTHSSTPGRAILGLRILGRCPAKGTDTILLRFLADGTAALTQEEGNKLVKGLNAPDGSDPQLRLAAIRALGDRAEPNLLQPARKALAAWQRKRKTASANPELEKDIEEESEAACCLMGDNQAAVFLIRRIVENKQQIEAYTNDLERRMYSPDKKKLAERAKARRQIPILHARNLQLSRVLSHFPASGLAALATSAGSWQNELAIPPLLACLRRRPGEMLTPTARAALGAFIHNCALRPVRALCAMRLRLDKNKTRL